MQPRDLRPDDSESMSVPNLNTEWIRSGRAMKQVTATVRAEPRIEPGPASGSRPALKLGWLLALS